MSAPRAYQFIALRRLAAGGSRRQLHMTGPATFPSPLLTAERPVSNLPRDIAGLRGAGIALVAGSAVARPVVGGGGRPMDAEKNGKESEAAHGIILHGGQPRVKVENIAGRAPANARLRHCDRCRNPLDLTECGAVPGPGTG